VKILLLIRALTAGGAERQVAVLAQGLRQRGHDAKVMVFYGGGALEGDLESAGVPLIVIGKRGRWDVPGFLWRLLKALRRERPDVIYSWLPVANLLALAFKPLLPGAKLAWAVCASNMDLSRYDWLVRLTTRVEARCSRWVPCVISNSHSGRDYAIGDGFPASTLKVVPNGIDTARFRPDRAIGLPLRAEWGVAERQPLIGLVGRLDPMKGHPVFLRAAEKLSERLPEARFVCVGDGAADYRQSLRALADWLGLGEKLIWTGTRVDMPEVYNALDIAVSSSSYGEGLPNMLGEAMACGVPCVVTEVGDSAWVVGDTGVVVPPDAPEALAEGIAALLGRGQEEGAALSSAVRQRIERNLGIETLVDGTLAELSALG
jgi:glycosyltransferase involved in cell wall biosynthesis